MTIRIICVGKLKQSCYVQACDEFLKRLSRYAECSVVELPDEKAPETLSPAQKRMVTEAEGTRILQKIAEGDYVIAMDLGGKQLDSPAMAAFLQAKMSEGKSKFDFIIGGSLGLSQSVLSRADFRLSFGANTFSHQIFRIMLLEQIYRCFKINANEPYHK